MLSKSSHGKNYRIPRYPMDKSFTSSKNRRNLLRSCSLRQSPVLVSKLAFSPNRSKKVQDPKLRPEGTECLQASQCTLVLPEVSGLAGHSSQLFLPLGFPSPLGTWDVLSTLPGSASYKGDLEDDRINVFKPRCSKVILQSPELSRYVNYAKCYYIITPRTFSNVNSGFYLHTCHEGSRSSFQNGIKFFCEMPSL